MLLRRSLGLFNHTPSSCITCSRVPFIRFLSTTKPSNPLRILFCGSDDFSIASLKAVNAVRESNPVIVKSIDVVSRPPKPYGRGLKKIREVPITYAARLLGLPLHQIDTFTGWQPPTDFDLIIAVSFGLLIPRRILTAAQYGGINIHPSLLPDLRGAAPIPWALINKRLRTGITLQTLHPTRMDHGRILAQVPVQLSPRNGQTAAELTSLLTPIAADLLMQGLQEGKYGEAKEVPSLLDEKELQRIKHAPRITNNTHHINWKEWTANDILMRDKILSGPLWNMYKTKSTDSLDDSNGTNRVKWVEGFERSTSSECPDTPPGVAFARHENNKWGTFLTTVDRKVLRAKRVRFAGSKSVDEFFTARQALSNNKGRPGTSHDLPVELW